MGEVLEERDSLRISFKSPPRTRAQWARGAGTDFPLDPGEPQERKTKGGRVRTPGLRKTDYSASLSSSPLSPLLPRCLFLEKTGEERRQERRTLRLRDDPVCNAKSCYLAAVGMAADSADTSLLTSAIDEDPTESPNTNRSGRSEILHRHHHHHLHPRGKDAPRKCRRDQNGALLRDFDEVIDYVDYARLIRSWLSRICSKSCAFFFS